MHRVLVLASLMAITACSPGGGTGGGACDSDEDCSAAQFCLDGTCTARVDSALPDSGGEDAAEDASSDSGGDSTVGDTGGDAGPDDRLVPEGECMLEAVPDAFRDPETELHWEAEDGMPFAGISQMVSTPVVIDIIPEPAGMDPVPEIIFTSYGTNFGNGGVVRVIDGRAPHTLRFSLAGDGADPGATEGARRIADDAHLAAGDIDGDGMVEIVTSLRAGGAIAWNHDGTELWRNTAADIPAVEMEANGSWSLHDLDGDGTVEAIIGRVVVNGADGTVRWTGTGDRGKNGQGPLSCVADIVAASPGQEVIAGGTAYSADGAILWENAGDGFCAVADILNGDEPGTDGRPEVVRVVNGALRIADGETGMERRDITLPGCGGGFGRGGAPTVADFDGDGEVEIGIAGARCYVVMDLTCTAEMDGCNGNNELWRRATQDTSSNVTSSTVFDFNGDGRAEVVYNDERNFQVLDGIDGTVIFMEPNPSRTRTEQPIVADVDADGNAEIVFGANNESGISGAVPIEDRIPGLEIWSSSDDSWVGARPIWNQHTYHIDHVDDRGQILSPETPSWTTHNTYRLNRANGDSLAGPDLGGDPEEGMCDEGGLTICVTILNRGDATVGAGLEVEFRQGDEMGEVIGRGETTGSLERGEEERVCVVWEDAPAAATPAVAIIDPDMTERECFEDNNVIMFEAGCAGPG